MKFWIAHLLNLAVTVVGVNQEVTLRLRNESDEYISIHWVDPRTQATALIKGDIKPDLAFTFNSYLTHRFEVWQLPDPDTGLCGGEEKADEQSCKINYFQVTEFPEQGKDAVCKEKKMDEGNAQILLLMILLSFSLLVI